MLTGIERASIKNTARVLVTTCDVTLVASIVDALLCVDEEERLSDHDIEVGRLLFHHLTEMRPESVAIASGAPVV